MNQKFYKYQGAGNDFILIDNRLQQFNHQQPEVLAQLCDRRFGIGADGIMFLQLKEAFDFEMVYYNADGKPSSMCGNGGRCIVAFARFLGLILDKTYFLAVDGEHFAKISDNGDWVSLQMIDVDFFSRDHDAYILDTGSPHYVQLTENLSAKNVFADGRAIRNSLSYKKEGINVNFVEPMDGGYFVRTYERGVEAETFACGTGVTAVALAMAHKQKLTGTINTSIKVLGGEMNICFDYNGKRFSNIFLEGPAKKVFCGEIDI